jgi:hypothetical protein
LKDVCREGDASAESRITSVISPGGGSTEAPVPFSRRRCAGNGGDGALMTGLRRGSVTEGIEMVGLRFSLKSVRWPAGLLSLVAGLGLVIVFAVSFAKDPLPADGETKVNEVPRTARAEAGSTSTASAQELPLPPIDAAHPLYLPLQEAYKAREALKGVKDYEAEFVKRELIGRKLLKTTMKLKLRHEPFSVYLKFLDASAGREVIFVEGRNKGNLYVHEAGIRSLVGTLSLLPTGPDAMADNRYPVTMIGLQTVIDKVIKQWEAEGKFGEVKTQKYPDAKLPTGEECVAYESLHPTPRNQFKFHITRLWIDKKTGLAIRVEQLGFPSSSDRAPPIIEEYTYGKVKTNVSLTDRDFDTKNPAYAF